MCINYMVELSRSPSRSRFCPLIYLIWKNLTVPAGSPLSTQPTSWATTSGPDVPSCSCTPAIVERVHVHLAWSTWAQDHQQTLACLASEGPRPRWHIPSNFLQKPVHHPNIRVHTQIVQVCTQMNPVHTIIYCYILNTNKSIHIFIKFYRCTPHHGWTVEHGDQCRVLNPCLAGQVKITVWECNRFY